MSRKILAFNLTLPPLELHELLRVFIGLHKCRLSSGNGPSALWDTKPPVWPITLAEGDRSTQSPLLQINFTEQLNDVAAHLGQSVEQQRHSDFPEGELFPNDTQGFSEKFFFLPLDFFFFPPQFFIFIFTP